MCVYVYMCLENWEYGRRDPSRWPRGTLYPQKLAITSPTSGGSSVGIVRSRTQTMEFICLFCMCVCVCVRACVCVCVCAHARDGGMWKGVEIHIWEYSADSAFDFGVNNRKICRYVGAPEKLLLNIRLKIVNKSTEICPENDIKQFSQSQIPFWQFEREEVAESRSVLVLTNRPTFVSTEIVIF
jgi:hypothetical protein